MKYLLVLGAKSDMAKAMAKTYAAQGYNLILAGRSIQDALEFANTLKTSYGVSVELRECDILDMNTCDSFVRKLNLPLIGAICCIGYLGDQEKSEQDTTEAVKIMNSNYVGCVSVLNKVALELEKQQEGFIIGVSSVAGERGRKSNYLYGSAKAGFTAYLSGLRARLQEKNIHVLTVKPGFVATKMTAHLELSKALTANVDTLAKKVLYAQKRKKNTLYVKSVWKWIMLVIRFIPEFIFKKMKL